MKIGDKVRFLLEKGGGKVAGFQGKDIVLVEDEDGFEIPMPVKQCVVVDTNEYNIAKVHTLDEDKKPKIAEPEETDEVDIDKPITYKRRVEERKDGNKVNVFLAYVPKDIKMLTNTTFDAYIVNDCNYYIFYTYLCGEGNSWRLHSQGVLEPNSKIQMEEFGLAQLACFIRECRDQAPCFIRYAGVCCDRPAKTIVDRCALAFVTLSVFVCIVVRNLNPCEVCRIVGIIVGFCHPGTIQIQADLSGHEHRIARGICHGIL